MKKLIAVLLALVFVFALFGCTQDGKNNAPASSGDQQNNNASGEEFVVGTFCPLSGSSAEFGEACLNSVNLWAKKVNANGGILGKYTVRVVAYDDGHDAANAIPVATKLLNNDNINVCVGSQASATISPVVDLFEKAQVPLFGNGTSPSFMQLGMEYTWRATVNQDNVIRETAELMKELGMKSVALFTLQDDAGQASGDSLEAFCKELGIEVTTREYCVDGDTDYSGQAAKIIASDPDCVFIGTSSPPVAIFANAMRDMGYDGLIFGKDAVMPSQIEAANGNLDQYVFAFPSIVYTSLEQAGDNEILKDYLESYKEEYGEYPPVESCFRAYDSCLVIEAAVNIAQSINPAEINKAISQVKITGVQGELDFTQGHEGLATINRWIVVNNAYVKLADWIADGSYDAYLNTRSWRK